MLAVSRWMARSAFGIGLAVGAILNLGLIPLLEAKGDPQPTVIQSVEIVADAGPDLPVFGELQRVNLDVQARLFNVPYSGASPMQLAIEPVGVGTYPGFTDSMDAFVLTVETIRPVEYAGAGLLTSEQASWAVQTHWTAYVFAGLIESGTASVWASGLITCFDAPGRGRVQAVVVGSFSDFQSGVVKLNETTATLGAEAGGATAAGNASGAQPGTACDNDSCMAKLGACEEGFNSTMDACYVSLELALGALVGCAIGLTVSLYACFLTGVGCVLLGWLGVVCGPAIMTALAAFAGCTALALGAYANCKLRTNADPVCGCLVTH